MDSYYGKTKTSDVQSLSVKYGIALNVYEHIPNAFTVDGTGQDFLLKMIDLANDPDVAFLQPNHMRITTCEVDLTTVSASGVKTPDLAAWHLEYSCRRNKSDPSSAYTPNYTGAGVDAYVIDTGILYGHQNLAGAQQLPGYVDPFGGNGIDGHGHGTHVAGIIGGSVTGIAPACNVFGVRVMDGAGAGLTPTVMLTAVNAIIAHHLTSGKPAVANFSIASSPDVTNNVLFEEDPTVYDDFLDDSLRMLRDAGIVVTVAAGNGSAQGKGFNAKYVRPARASSLITVGAIDQSSLKTSWSNYGRCVDIWAPGMNIYSASIGASPYIYMSGTSMAAPCVAGICALMLQQHPNYTVDQITSLLTTCCSQNQISNLSSANSLTSDGLLANPFQMYSYNTGMAVAYAFPYEVGETFPNRIAVINSINSSAVLNDGRN